jgi:hypothetical protein
MDRAPRREWLIVSRWGEGGRFLSISRCLIPVVTASAPFGLSPVETALAVLIPAPGAERTPGFLFARRLPARMVLAGTFMPVEGYACLRHRTGRLRLTAEGRCMPRADAWRLDASQEPWDGEFLDTGGP